MADGVRRNTHRRKGSRGRAGARSVAKSGARRAGSGQTSFERAIADLGRFLGELEEPSAVIGGVALIIWGRARNTSDIDAAVSTTPDHAETLIERAARFGIEPRVADAAAFAEQSMVLLLRHSATGIPIDLSFAQLAFERSALAAAVERPFGSVTIRVPVPSALVVYKMVASRPKDLEDVEDLLLRRTRIDVAFVVATLRAFDELLDTNRADDFERIWARIRSELEG